MNPEHPGVTSDDDYEHNVEKVSNLFCLLLIDKVRVKQKTYI